MRAWLPALGVAAVLGGLLWGVGASESPAGWRDLGGYATRLTGRSASQRHNACLAARAIDGVRIAPGATFSVNARVGPWSREPGYVRAPVSVDGAMVSALGGGVCQTTSTLYNAALLAGLEVRERHPHTVAPRYVPPGRDAAVAWPGVDLRLRNPYPWPVTIAASVSGARLEVRIRGAGSGAERVTIESRVSSVREAGARAVPSAPGRRGTRGATGFRVVTTRLIQRPGGETVRERLGDDVYAAVDAMIPVSN